MGALPPLVERRLLFPRRARTGRYKQVSVTRSIGWHTTAKESLACGGLFAPGPLALTALF
jgi:hypothetical protein